MKNKKKLLHNSADSTILDAALSPLLKIVEKNIGFFPTDFWKSMEFARETTNPKFKEHPDIKIIEQNFNKFTHQFSKSSHDALIPRLLHFIWLGSSLPDEAKVIIKTWKKCHPKWEIIVWSDKDVDKISWTNPYIKLAFQDARTWAEKADILRYEILYKMGGIYSDIDSICFHSFDDLIAQPISCFAGLVENTFFLGNEGELHIANGLVGCTKGHPVIKYCLNHLITEDEEPTRTISSRTGPALFTRACHEEFHSARSEEILILPCSYFYSLPYFHFWKNKQITAQQIHDHFIAPESLSVHLWANTWAL